MKVRRDFVTNSSSSSFIISKDSISHDKLLEILFEIANEEAKWWGREEYVWDEDVKHDVVGGHYHITESSLECPYEFYDDFYCTQEKKYDNHFIIDNDCCCRYNWHIIEKILSKHNILWEYGYCD